MVKKGVAVKKFNPLSYTTVRDLKYFIGQYLEEIETLQFRIDNDKKRVKELNKKLRDTSREYKRRSK